MPAIGKEFEPQPTPEQIATREMQGYVEKVEKQVENQQPQQQQVAQPQQQQVKPVDMGRVVSSQFAQSGKPKIVLPLNQKEVEVGLHNKVAEGVRWLAEWCVFMIKKYPGRVFYSPPSNN